MLQLDDLGKVELPDLQGEFILGVFLGSGYTYGALARTEKGFQTVALRLMEDGLKSRFEPEKIKIVSPSFEALGHLAVKHNGAVQQSHRFEVESKVSEYYRLSGTLPKGFRFTKTREEDENRVFTIWGDRAKKMVRWLGKASLVSTFPTQKEPLWTKCTGSTPSAERYAGDLMDLSVAFGGFRGGCGTPFGVSHFASSDRPLNVAPLFYYHWVGTATGLLGPVAQKFKALKDLENLERERKKGDRDRERAEEDAKALADLVAIFGPPRKTKAR